MKAWLSMLAAVVLCVLGGGCAEEPPDQAPTLASWQTSVEQYVWDHGNGDPTILADMSWDDVHRGFALIGNPQPAESTDMIGLLVAHRMVDGVPYFVFLLADVDHEKLVGLRPVALNVSGGQFHWFVGKENSQSLDPYRDGSRIDRRTSGPDDPAPPAFPRAGDVFEVRVVSDTEISIVHPPSGAVWMVRLRAPK